MKDFALGVAPPHLDDAVLDGREPGRGARVLASREGVDPLHHRHHDLGQGPVARFLSPLAQALELGLGRAPVARGAEGHAHVEVVEEEQRHLEPAPRRCPEVLPAGGVGPAIEVEPPREGNRVLQVGAHGDGHAAEDAVEELAHAVIAPFRQVHEGEVPEEMIPEIAEMVAGMDARRERFHAALVLAALVEHVGHRVDGPRVFGIEGEGPLGEGQGLGVEPVLLQGEGVVPEEVAVGGHSGDRPCQK